MTDKNCWIEIKSNRPIDMITNQKCGAFKYRIVNEGNEQPTIEIMCRHLFNKSETLVVFPGIFKEGFQKWLAGGLIQECLPFVDVGRRELLINGV